MVFQSFNIRIQENEYYRVVREWTDPSQMHAVQTLDKPTATTQPLMIVDVQPDCPMY